MTPIGFGGYPFAGVNRARGWDPYTPGGRRAAIGALNHAHCWSPAPRPRSPAKARAVRIQVPRIDEHEVVVFE